MTETKQVRNEKDRVFKIVFKEKENLLSLYNALAGTSYDDASQLEVNTLEDVVFVGMKNDVSFLLDGKLNLFEHQSTVNLNMPLRGLYYLTDLYKQRYNGKQLYSSNLLKIPTPQFIVFYNGTTKIPDRMDLRLSDAFEHPTEKPDLEVVAHIININLGHNQDLLSKCKVLLDYVTFHQRIRDNIASRMTREKAVEGAVDSCIRDGILEDILRKERAKIVASVLAEFDQEEYEEMIRRESEEKGFQRGISQGQIQERIASILELLEDVGTIPEHIQKTIEAQTEIEKLKSIFKLATKASSIDEFEKKMNVIIK